MSIKSRAECYWICSPQSTAVGWKDLLLLATSNRRKNLDDACIIPVARLRHSGSSTQALRQSVELGICPKMFWELSWGFLGVIFVCMWEMKSIEYRQYKVFDREITV